MSPLSLETFCNEVLNISCNLVNTVLKALTMWNTTLWKILKEMGIPEQLTCLLRNLYAGQVTTGHGTTDWFQIGKGVHRGCILSSCLFNLYAEHISTKGWAG